MGAPWGITNCAKCTTDGSKITCTECETNYYMKSDGSACQTSCALNSEKELPTSNANHFVCVTACPAGHLLTADELKCRLTADGCLDGEYDHDGSNCKLCSDNDMINCLKCNKTECTECKANYYWN